MIMFGEDWGRHPSSTQHLAMGFALSRAVLWVNSLGLRRPRPNLRDFRRLLAKAPGSAPAALHPFAGLVHPHAIPWPGSRLAAFANRHLLARQLGAVLAAADIEKPVLWTSLPTALPVIGALGERAVVYYAGDDFGALAGVDHGPVLRMEAQLAAKADLIFAASPLIASRFAAHKTHVLAHGVDAALFSHPAPRAPALDGLKKAAGFYGSLNAWLDVEGLAEAARALPDWTFLLVGRVETDITALKPLANVRFHDPVPHSALPGFSQHWSVSLLPFRRNRQIAASNPLKLREYLAAGTPVAASWKFPALEPYAGLTAIAGDRPLAEAILEAAADSGRNEERRALVAGESWAARVAEAESLISQL